MRPNHELEADVRTAISYDAPAVDRSEIAVSAGIGRVTLRGTVGSFYEKRAAGRAARHVIGVTDVDNQLQVRLMTERRYEDAQLRAVALQRLIYTAAVPSDAIDVEADDGRLTLTGEVDWRYQLDAAYDAVASMRGVTDVINSIKVRPAVAETSAIASDIEIALTRHAQVDARNIVVTPIDGHIVLTGSVSSLAERDAAVAAAWAAPGVIGVDDRIHVTR
jgi:osmotically-inducible protein OsmY